MPLKPLKYFLEDMKIPHVFPNKISVPLRLNPFIKTDEYGNRILSLTVIKEFLKHQLPGEVENALMQMIERRVC